MINFLKKIFLIDLVKGMWVTLKYTPQPAFTFQYPAERRPTAPRFRGVLRLQTEPATGAQTCIVCDQCAKACPDDLIALGGHREPGLKIKVLDYFDFNLSRCSFCGLCAEVCPTKPIKALIMSEDYELGSYSRDTQVLRVDEMVRRRADRTLHALTRGDGVFRISTLLFVFRKRGDVDYPSWREAGLGPILERASPLSVWSGESPPMLSDLEDSCESVSVRRRSRAFWWPLR